MLLGRNSLISDETGMKVSLEKLRDAYRHCDSIVNQLTLIVMRPLVRNMPKSAEWKWR